MKERIAKRIAKSQICSRRTAEKWILQHRIKVNDVLIDTPAFLVDNSDKITIDDNPLPDTPEPKIWLYYKPMGLLTTHHDPQDRPTIFAELKKKGMGHLISVGRLDLNSEGLLLLTNTPALAHYLELPKNAFNRVYKVRVFGTINPEKLLELSKGVTIDNVNYLPIKVKILHSFSGNKGSMNQWLEIQLSEGKNREIRKVMEYCGVRVNRLIRLSFGPFKLNNLEVGEVFELKNLPQNFLKSIEKSA